MLRHSDVRGASVAVTSQGVDRHFKLPPEPVELYRQGICQAIFVPARECQVVLVRQLLYCPGVQWSPPVSTLTSDHYWSIQSCLYTYTGDMPYNTNIYNLISNINTQFENKFKWLNDLLKYFPSTKDNQWAVRVVKFMRKLIRSIWNKGVTGLSLNIVCSQVCHII